MSVVAYPRSTSGAEMRSGLRRAWRINERTFKVYGRQGDEYLIPIVGGVPGPCPCPDRTGACWHLGLVAQRLLRERSEAAHGSKLEQAIAVGVVPVVDPTDTFDDIDWEALR